jgi:hypothetical protein
METIRDISISTLPDPGKKHFFFVERTKLRAENRERRLANSINILIKGNSIDRL